MESTRRLQSDAPLAGLPLTEGLLLDASPVEVAIAEVRFGGSTTGITSEHAIKIQAMAHDRGVPLTSIQPAQQQELMMQLMGAGAPSPQVTIRAQGWQFASEDKSLVATVMPDSVIVQVTKYERWSQSLGHPLEVLLDSVRDLLSPELTFRLGLRYINRLVDKAAISPKAWEGRIRNSLLGPILDPVFTEMVISANQQLELSFGGGLGATIRHGAFRDGANHNSYSYLLDLDVFDSSTAAFEASAIISHLTQMNRSALSMFEQATTAEYRATLKPRPRRDEEKKESPSKLDEGE